MEEIKLSVNSIKYIGIKERAISQLSSYHEKPDEVVPGFIGLLLTASDSCNREIR